MTNTRFRPIRLPLFHYTCHHGYRHIDRTLVPVARMMDQRQRARLYAMSQSARMAAQVVWFTTLDDLTYFNRTAVGHTYELTHCDRTRYRFRALGGYLVPWRVARLSWPEQVVRELESVPGSRPLTWWLSAAPVPVKFDPHIRLEEEADALRA